MGGVYVEYRHDIKVLEIFQPMDFWKTLGAGKIGLHSATVDGSEIPRPTHRLDV